VSAESSNERLNKDHPTLYEPNPPAVQHTQGKPRRDEDEEEEERPSADARPSQPTSEDVDMETGRTVGASDLPEDGEITDRGEGGKIGEKREREDGELSDQGESTAQAKRRKISGNSKEREGDDQGQLKEHRSERRGGNDKDQNSVSDEDHRRKDDVQGQRKDSDEESQTNDSDEEAAGNEQSTVSDIRLYSINHNAHAFFSGNSSVSVKRANKLSVRRIKAKPYYVSLREVKNHILRRGKVDPKRNPPSRRPNRKRRIESARRKQGNKRKTRKTRKTRKKNSPSVKRTSAGGKSTINRLREAWRTCLQSTL
jgi:hypothetical protein